jgi:hypothetical protein
MFVVAVGMPARSVSATPDPAAVCDVVSDVAAREAGLPVSMLRALTRTETGRARSGRLTPWPWTVNMEGAGHWFDDREAALAFASKHHARGATSFDIGCFQINYRWHNKAFASIEAMFDPLENARYAAKYLQELKAESGDWQTAVGHYHSRTPSRAQKYVARYTRIKAKLTSHSSDITRVAQALTKPADHAPVPVPAPAPVAIVASKPRAAVSPATPGGVSLAGFSQTAGLLTPARPLFD